MNLLNLSHRARTTAEMTHLYASRRDHYFAITQRLHVIAVYAQTEWPGISRVRCVKSPQPGKGAGIRFMERRATHRTACTLYPIDREARCKQVQRCPLHIPVPKSY